MLNRLLEPDAARRFLEKELPLFQGPDSPRLGASRLRDVRLGKWWELQYVLTIQGEKGAPLTRPMVTCHLAPKESLARTSLRARRLLGKIRHEDPLLAGLFLHKAQDGLLVVPFPLDPKLPQLVEATDPGQAARRLTGVLGAATSIRRIEILRFVAGKRCQIRYHFRSGRTGSLLGKTFRDSRGQDLGALMNRVADLFDVAGNPKLSAPRSPGYLPEWQMVLQEDVGGLTLHQLARNGGLEEAHLRGAAECLATLHGSSLTVPGRHLIEEEVALLRSALARLQQADRAGPAQASLLLQLARSGRTLPAGRLAPVHRDFYDKQIVVQGSRLFLIDLDTATLSFPEIDVANFVAHLRLRSLQDADRLVEDPEELFLDAYTRAFSAPDPGRFRFFLAAALFRLGCLYRLRCQGNRLATRLFEVAGRELGRLQPRTPVPRVGER